MRYRPWRLVLAGGGLAALLAAPLGAAAQGVVGLIGLLVATGLGVVATAS